VQVADLADEHLISIGPQVQPLAHVQVPRAVGQRFDLGGRRSYAAR